MDFAGQELDIMVHHVPRDEVRGIVATIQERYGQSSHEGALWECLVSSAPLYDPSGWLRIGELAGGCDLAMVIEDIDGPSGIYLADSRSLTRLLAEAEGFAFYVTDAEVSYVLA